MLDIDRGIESPHIVQKRTVDKMPSVPKMLGQVLTLKPSDLMVNQSQKRHFHSSPFITTTTDSSYPVKELPCEPDQENKEPQISDLPPTYDEVAVAEESGQIEHIAQKIENELKIAKRRTIECTEVLVPKNLIQQIAMDIVTMAESEPCGLRGGVLYLMLSVDDQEDGLRRIGSVNIGDSRLVPTFELQLTLQSRGSPANWIKHFFRPRENNTLVISSDYRLAKRKLYRDD